MNKSLLFSILIISFLFVFSQSQAQKVWNGTSDTYWRTATNWTPNGVPSASDNVIIPAKTATKLVRIRYANAVCNNLTIQAGGQLTIKGKELHVYGNLKIESPSNTGLAGSLIEKGDVGDRIIIDGTTTIQRYYPSAGKYTYISSPVKNNNSDLFTVGTASSGVFNPNLYRYNETYDCTPNPTGTNSVELYEQWTTTDLVEAWEEHHGGEGGVAQILSEGKGYAFYNDVDVNINYTGSKETSLSHGDISIPVTLNSNDGNSDFFDGWNLIGNPYPASYRLGDRTPGDVTLTFYIWDGVAQNYKYFNYYTGTYPGISGYVNDGGSYGAIPPGQAFFVKATSNGNFNFKASKETHGSENITKTRDTDLQSDVQFVKLKIESNGYSDETVIRLIEGATTGIDDDFDAYKLNVMDNNVPQIYTYSNENIIPLAINTLPKSNDNYTILLGYRFADANNYTITVSASNLSNSNAILEDTYKNKFINLKINKSYTFVHTGGAVEDRFKLHIKENLVNVENVENKLQVYPNPTKGIFTINLSEIQDVKSIDIKDITGRQIYSNNNIKDNFNEIDISNQNNGIYFINIYTNSEIITKKIIINK